MEIIERIKYVREKHNLNQKEFANLIGVSQGNVGDWERGRSLPSTSVIVKIVNQFNISADWLLIGNTCIKENQKYNFLENLNKEELNSIERFSKFLIWDRDNASVDDINLEYTSKQVVSKHHLLKENKEVIYIPYIGNAAAGDPLEIIEYPEGKLPVENKSSYYNAFIIKAKGDSMIEAGINDGDLVIVKPQPVVENGEMALVDINNEATIKHFYLLNGQVELRPANPNYNTLNYSLKDNKVKVKGKILGVINKEEAEKNMIPVD